MYEPINLNGWLNDMNFCFFLLHIPLRGRVGLVAITIASMAMCFAYHRFSFREFTIQFCKIFLKRNKTKFSLILFYLWHKLREWRTGSSNQTWVPACLVYEILMAGTVHPCACLLSCVH